MRSLRPTLHISFEQSSKICFQQKSLNNGLSWAHYQNDHERLFYVNNKQHTLSMYLSGGFQTHRTDIQSDYGAPGRFCLMPKNSETHWHVGTTQQFMHLYFDDNYLNLHSVQFYKKQIIKNSFNNM